MIQAATGRRLKYGELAADAARMPVPETVALKEPKAFRLIGTPAKRLDIAGKVNGTAVYGIDVRPPGVRIATLAQSPVFGGRLKSVDDAAALAVKGVRQVVRLDDAVAVVADHMGAAKKGLEALVIEWEDGPHAKLTTAAVAAELEQATLGPGAVAQSIGDADQAMADAVTKVDAIYQLPFLAHAALEPMNCTVHVRKDGCEVWVGTQAITRAQAAAAEATGLPLDKVVVHNHLIGGGFGRRLEADGVGRAAQIATHVEGPVKVVWTREEDIQHDMYRPYWFDRMSAGLGENGMPTAWTHRFAGSSVIARYLPPAFKDGIDPDSVEGAIDLPYALPNLHVDICASSRPAFRPPSGGASGHRTRSSWSKALWMSLLRRPSKTRSRIGWRFLEPPRAPRRYWNSLRRKPAGALLYRIVQAGGWRSSSSSALTWRRLPKWRSRMTAPCASVVWCARLIAAQSSTPTSSALKSRAASSLASRRRSMVRSPLRRARRADEL